MSTAFTRPYAAPDLSAVGFSQAARLSDDVTAALGQHWDDTRRDAPDHPHGAMLAGSLYGDKYDALFEMPFYTWSASGSRIYQGGNLAQWRRFHDPKTLAAEFDARPYWSRGMYFGSSSVVFLRNDVTILDTLPSGHRGIWADQWLGGLDQLVAERFAPLKAAGVDLHWVVIDDETRLDVWSITKDQARPFGDGTASKPGNWEANAADPRWPALLTSFAEEYDCELGPRLAEDLRAANPQSSQLAWAWNDFQHRRVASWWDALYCRLDALWPGIGFTCSNHFRTAARFYPAERPSMYSASPAGIGTLAGTHQSVKCYGTADGKIFAPRISAEVARPKTEWAKFLDDYRRRQAAAVASQAPILPWLQCMTGNTWYDSDLGGETVVGACLAARGPVVVSQQQTADPAMVRAWNARLADRLKWLDRFCSAGDVYSASANPLPLDRRWTAEMANGLTRLVVDPAATLSVVQIGGGVVSLKVDDETVAFRGTVVELAKSGAWIKAWT